MNRIQGPTFGSRLTPADIRYKQALINGIQHSYQFTPKIEALDSIAGPDEFKELISKFLKKHFTLGFRKLGQLDGKHIFDNIKSGKYRVNLHAHTVNSDGTMTPEVFLEQSLKYADKVAKLKPHDNLPPYTSAITDHNNFDSVRETLAMIADEPKKYKNYKFVPGCEFRFLEKEQVLENQDYEALGYCFNPFDENLHSNVGKYNSTDIIPELKKFGGLLSYAHPLRHCQKNKFTESFMDYLQSKGIEGLESNYQHVRLVYTDELKEAEEFVEKIVTERNLFKTGGTDTHSNNIFCSSASEIIDELLK